MDHLVQVAALALTALLAAGAAVLRVARARSAEAPRARASPPPPVARPSRAVHDEGTIACRRLGREARFVAVRFEGDGDTTPLAASPAFAVGRRGSVRATAEAQAMHDALMRYLQRVGWEADAASGEDWYSTSLRRPRNGAGPAPLVPAPAPAPAPAAPEPEAEAAGKPGRRDLKAFTGLTGAQIFQLAASLVTAPLMARALGAEGRGLLAAIAVPLGVAPFLLQFGLGAFAINRAAQGMSPRLVFGSMGLPTLALGGLTVLLAPTIAGVLSEGREPVQAFLVIGLALMPLGLLINLVMNIAHGLSDWRALTLVRALPPVVLLVGVAGLFALDRLTVTSAGIVTIVSGIAPVVALGPTLRRCWPPKVQLRVVREGLGFGARAWVGTLATLANQRLDQLLMIPLVPARQLGLYAVAVTISGLSTLLTSQVVTVLIPRIAHGQSDLVPQALRCLLLVVSATAVVLAAATLVFLVPVFGPDFAGARPLVLVLLVAVVPLSGLHALSQWLPATNRPGAPSLGELVSLAITVPGLILLLPTMGAMGAALVSLVAYSTSFAILLVVMSRHLGHRIIDYLTPRRADIVLLARIARAFPLRAAAHAA